MRRTKNRLVLALVIALSVAVGFFLGVSLPLVISTVVGSPVCVGEEWGGHSASFTSENYVEDPRHTLLKEARENVMRVCSAQLAERRDLTTPAASALVESLWQIADKVSEQAVDVIEAKDLRPEDRPDLYATFGQSCMLAVEKTYFQGKGDSVHLPTNRERRAPPVEAFLDGKGNGTGFPVNGREPQ